MNMLKLNKIVNIQFAISGLLHINIKNASLLQKVEMSHNHGLVIYQDTESILYNFV